MVDRVTRLEGQHDFTVTSKQVSVVLLQITVLQYWKCVVDPGCSGIADASTPYPNDRIVYDSFY